MFDPEKLIRKGLPKGHFKDLLVRSLLGGATYFVVIIAALLFGKIIIDGAPVLFPYREGVGVGAFPSVIPTASKANFALLISASVTPAEAFKSVAA